MKKLIINADDFGLSASANRTIIECYLKGNLTSATLLVNMPGTENAVRLSKENLGLGIGLHFCLTEGRPLTNCPTLVDDKGEFLTRNALLRRLFWGGVAPDEIAAEFSAQLQRIRSFGIALTHLDSHQHVHMSPWVLKNILPIINESGIPLRIVCPPLSAALLLKRPIKFFKQLVLVRASRGMLGAVKNKANDSLVSINDLSAEQDIDASTYLELIRSASDSEIIEVMVHPYSLGQDAAALYPNDLHDRLPFLRRCEREYQLLSRERLSFDSTGCELTNYARI